MLLRDERQQLSRSRGTNDDDDDGGGVRVVGADENRSLDMRRRASIVRRQFEMSMSDETRRLIEEEHERVIVDRKRRNDASCNANDDDGEVVFGLIASGGGGSSASSNLVRARSIKRRGGATMNVKRVLQRNLNVVRGNRVILYFFHDPCVIGRVSRRHDVVTNRSHDLFTYINDFARGPTHFLFPLHRVSRR